MRQCRGRSADGHYRMRQAPLPVCLVGPPPVAMPFTGVPTRPATCGNALHRCAHTARHLWQCPSPVCPHGPPLVAMPFTGVLRYAATCGGQFAGSPAAKQPPEEAALPGLLLDFDFGERGGFVGTFAGGQGEARVRRRGVRLGGDGRRGGLRRAGGAGG